MSYEIFVGAPDKRIVRLSDLMPYYTAETAPAALARKRAMSDMPPPVQAFLKGVGVERAPGTRPAVDLKGAECKFSTTGALIVIEEPMIERLRSEMMSLALACGVLYIDATTGSWIEARRPRDNSANDSGMTSERCVIKHPCNEDIAQLCTNEWFADRKFFWIAPAEYHFVQVLRFGNTFVAEFRSRRELPIYRTQIAKIKDVAAFLTGYLAGENMNNETYRFGPLYNADDSVQGFPPRLHDGKWIAPGPEPLGKGFAMSSTLKQ
jgi:hypothetical protein